YITIPHLSRRPKHTHFPYTTLFRSLMQTQIKPTAEQVLVIDDDAELCKLVTRYLTQEGFQIESVNGGASGAELALSGNYALVVRSEEHTSELQSLRHLVCRLLLEKK